MPAGNSPLEDDGYFEFGSWVLKGLELNPLRSAWGLYFSVDQDENKHPFFDGLFMISNGWWKQRPFKFDAGRLKAAGVNQIQKNIKKA